jgi:probable addiction module antidote protein
MTKPKNHPRKYRDNPVAVAQNLTRALETNDLGSALEAFRTVLLDQNVSELSGKAGMRRDSLYRTFRGKADPRFSRILSLLAGLDVRFVVQSLHPKEKPPRPKPSRPLRTKGLKTKAASSS